MEDVPSTLSDAYMKPYTLYVRAVKQWIGVLLLVSGGTGLVAYGGAVRSSPQYDVHFSYVVSLANREEAESYTFDGYYALQATDLFTATLAQWVQAPEMVVAAYREAGVSVVPESRRLLARHVRAVKTGPQIIEVTVHDESADKAELLAVGVQRVIARAIEEYHAAGVPALSFRVIATDSWTSRQDVAAGLIGVAVGMGLFLIMINGLLLVVALRMKDEEEIRDV